MATALKICSFSSLHSSLLRPDHYICAGMDVYVQMICRLLACKQTVGDAISVKTLVQRSPGLSGLPDPLHRPCSGIHVSRVSMSDVGIEVD